MQYNFMFVFKFLSNVIMIKNKVLLPQAYVTIAKIGSPRLLNYFPIFWI